MSLLGPVATEIIGNLLALWCIALIARNSVWNWPVGIANCLFYIALFYPAKLYGDCLLQVVYIVLSLVGIYLWLFGNGGIGRRKSGADTELPTTRSSPRALVGYGTALVAGSVILGGLLHGVTDTDVPYWDGATTAGCLVATWILAQRRIENWWMWIGTNVSYFLLYYHKGLYITQWCQIVFLAVSVVGYLRWRRELKAAVPITA